MHSDDQRRIFRVVLNLLAQPGDQDVDRTITGIKLPVVEMIKKVVAGKHLPLVGGQGRQKFKFARASNAPARRPCL